MNKQFKNKLILFLLILVSFYSGFVACNFVNSFNKGFPELLNIEDGAKIENKADFDVFWDAWEVIEDKYTAEPLDYQEMVYGAVSGMVDSLGDPYTVFFSPDENRMFTEDMKGSFGGIGAEIGFRDGLLTVISPLKDSPAEKAGLLSGDKIIKVDDEEIIGMSIDEAVLLIRGERGTKVALMIIRDGFDDIIETEIIRDVIVIKTVEWEMKDGKIAYISISQFKQDSTIELDVHIDNIISQDPRGIILDLRNNPGGYLNTAVEIASRFLDREKVVVIEDFRNSQIVHKTTGNKRFNNVPVVVLINEGSASASEILAGALKYNGAKLVGKKTFGKGLVQEFEGLKDGSAIKITVARWLTPDGININENGINPDFEIELSPDDYKNGMDPQLEKALELLR